MRISYTRPSFSTARAADGSSESTSRKGNSRNIIETPGWKRNRSDENVLVVTAADDLLTVNMGVPVDLALALLRFHEAAGQFRRFLPAHQLHRINALTIKRVIECRCLVNLAVMNVDGWEEHLASVGAGKLEGHRMNLLRFLPRLQFEDRKAEFLVGGQLVPGAGGEAEALVEAREILDGRNKGRLEGADVIHNQLRLGVRAVLGTLVTTARWRRGGEARGHVLEEVGVLFEIDEFQRIFRGWPWRR